MAEPDGGPEGRGLERARKPTPAVERTPAQHPVRRGSSGAPVPGGPQSLAGPPALLGSAGRSGLLRFAPARPPLTASGLDSGDGRSALRPARRGLEREPQPHARTTTTLTPWTLARVNLQHVDLARREPVSSTAGPAGVTHKGQNSTVRGPNREHR